ncbi:MAG: GMC family oxidoreductase [bacterium]
MNSYDYIIIGAGSAGCVMANRLSADPQCRVLLIEAGGKDWNPFIHMPAGLAQLVNFKSLNWCYYTQPEAQLNNRRLYWPRGKVIGGSSSINAMCYARGQAADYQHWESLGNPGWGWNNMLAMFKKSEHQQHGASALHGDSGPLHVQDLRYHSPLSETFIQAGTQAGWPENDDFNGEQQKGVGFYQVTQNNGQRWSAARAYLESVKDRPNLDVLTTNLVEQIIIENHRAIGVKIRKGRHQQTIHADCEVILSAGAIGSPHLLMLSGIGPGDNLKDNNVKVVHELEGVGANLQDHLDICTLYHCPRNITYDRLNDAVIGIQYLFTKAGVGSSNIAEAGGFVTSQYAQNDRPDIQLHFVPAMLDDHGRNRLKGNGFTMHACPLRPQSRGKISLLSQDPNTHPAIHANYLDHEQDRNLMLECVRIARDIFSQSAFNPVRSDEIFPGSERTSESQIMDFIRNKAETIYHPVGTCKMGRDDQAVVDHELKVHGIDGLRVVDASVMPTLVSGNTNAPTIAIAERVCEIML